MSKGSAVRGPRIQADRVRFSQAVRKLLFEHDIRLVECSIDRLLIEGSRCVGAQTSDGQLLSSRSVVLATGTFLGAKLYRGKAFITEC